MVKLLFEKHLLAGNRWHEIRKSSWVFVRWSWTIIPGHTKKIKLKKLIFKILSCNFALKTTRRKSLFDCFFTTFSILIDYLCEISVGWGVFKKCIFLKCRWRTSTFLTILVPHATFSRIEIIQLCLLQTLLAKTCIILKSL